MLGRLRGRTGPAKGDGSVGEAPPSPLTGTRAGFV